MIVASTIADADPERLPTAVTNVTALHEGPLRTPAASDQVEAITASIG